MPKRLMKMAAPAVWDLVLAVAILAALVPSMAHAADNLYVLTTIDFPGADVTQPYGINAAGQIVGTYQNAAPNNKNHGFVFKDWAFTAVDFPGSDTDYSIATAIGPGGDIVGYYGIVGEPLTSGHGFLLNKYGKWTKVDYPLDPTPTMTPSPFRILPDGTLVGCFHYANPAGAYLSMYGFTLAPNGAFSRFDYPDTAPFAMHYGATPDGKTIVGAYTVGGINHGYILSNGVVTKVDVPGSARTTPQDINEAGVIVGTYRNPGEPATVIHGFVLDTHQSTNPADWEFTFPADVPGASITRPRGINAEGDIVGDYIGPDGRNHGFLARQYKSIDSIGPKPTSTLKLSNTTNAARGPAFLVGDGFRVEVTDVPANALVYLRLFKDGEDLGISGPYGTTTDAQGRWSLAGTYDATAAGSWFVQALVGSTILSNQTGVVSLTVSKSAP